MARLLPVGCARKKRIACAGDLLPIRREAGKIRRGRLPDRRVRGEGPSSRYRIGESAMSTFRMFLNQESKSFAKGDTIFAVGDPADRMFIVAEGEVEISMGDQ